MVAHLIKSELILFFPIFFTFIFQFLASPENHVLFEKDSCIEDKKIICIEDKKERQNLQVSQ